LNGPNSEKPAKILKLDFPVLVRCLRRGVKGSRGGQGSERVSWRSGEGDKGLVATRGVKGSRGGQKRGKGSRGGQVWAGNSVATVVAGAGDDN